MRARAALWGSVVGLAIGGAAGWYLATRPDDEAPRQVRVSRPVQAGAGVELREQAVTVPRGVDPMRHAVEALAEPAGEGGSSALPAGTRVLSLEVRDGVATLDLSAEFAALAESGMTGESLAQEALLRCMAQFAEVNRLTVTVEGRPFEGEHSGPWTDLPVGARDAAGDGEARP